MVQVLVCGVSLGTQVPLHPNKRFFYSHTYQSDVQNTGKLACIVRFVPRVARNQTVSMTFFGSRCFRLAGILVDCHVPYKLPRSWLNAMCAFSMRCSRGEKETEIVFVQSLCEESQEEVHNLNQRVDFKAFSIFVGFINVY